MVLSLYLRSPLGIIFFQSLDKFGGAFEEPFLEDRTRPIAALVVGKHQRSLPALRQWPWPCDPGAMNGSLLCPVVSEFPKRRAWATVNKESGGGKKSGSGRGQPESHASSQKGGRLGGQASARRPAAERSAAAKKAAATRKRRGSS
jgi:hypothetical protein